MCNIFSICMCKLGFTAFTHIHICCTLYQVNLYDLHHAEMLLEILVCYKDREYFMLYACEPFLIGFNNIVHLQKTLLNKINNNKKNHSGPSHRT